MKKQIIQSVQVDWKHFTLEVNGQYKKGEQELRTFPNGDPGYPSTPSDFYIESIELIKGELLDFLQEVQFHAQKGLGFSIEEELEDLAIQKIEYDNL